MTKITRSDVYIQSEKGADWFQEFLETYAENKEAYTQELMNVIQDKRGNTVQGVVDHYREMVGLDSLSSSQTESDITASASAVGATMDEQSVYVTTPLGDFTLSKLSFPGQKDPFVRPEDLFDEKEFADLGADEAYELIDDIGDAIRDSFGEKVKVVGGLRWSCGECGSYDSEKEDTSRCNKCGFSPRDKAASSLFSKRAEEKEKEDVIVIIEKSPDVKRDLESLCRHSGGTKDTHAIINFLRDRLGKELVSYSNKDLVQYVEDTKSRFKEDLTEPHAEAGMVGTEDLDNVDETADYILHGKGK